ncbi:MAG TPA: uridine kinase [Candidatus Krumholzibacteria bacterium]|nr:uridine kinase [Candidatus Krumholzibacteria bacterium]
MDHASVQPVVIGIAGGSGSGKTTVALRVQERFPQRTVEIIHHDSYYHDHPNLDDESRAAINYDHPAAFETSLLVSHLDDLRAGREVERPIYDYSTHRRRSESEVVHPADIVFVEGILVLENADLRARMDIRLFVDVDSDERFIRRLGRDMEERGRSIGSVIEQYRDTVRPMHRQFVAPSKRWAHVIIPEGGHNVVAIDMICAKIHDVLRQRGRAEGTPAGREGVSP